MKKPNKPGTRLRGYGYHHQMVRKRWKPLVDRGEAACTRCGLLIPPGGDGWCPAILASGRRCPKNHRTWHLDHDDSDLRRIRYRGPAHVCCNVGAPGRRRSAVVRRSRAW